MPNCRNCGARITKFDKDICPVCGTKNPLQGVGSETMEVTGQIDLNGFAEGQKVICRRKKLLLYFLALGFTGAPFFYLKKKKILLTQSSRSQLYCRSNSIGLRHQCDYRCDIPFLTRS